VITLGFLSRRDAFLLAHPLLNALKTACYQCGAQVVYLRLCINHLLLAVTSIWDHSKGYPKDDGEDDDS